MAKNTTVVIGGIAVGVIIFLLLPTALKWLAVIAIIGVPAVGYFMLDSSQRRRLRERRRRQLGP